MASKRICVIGSFDTESANDGQTIKTLEIVKELCGKYGEDEVFQISYHNLKNSKFKLFTTLYKGISSCRSIVIISRHAAFFNLIRVCNMINTFFHRPIYQIMIGGALSETIEQRPEIKKIISKLDCVFAETETQRKAIADLGVDNVFFMPNFKNIRLYSEDELKRFKEPYPLVFMSRITEIKGVKELVDVIKKINSDKVRFTLDIYGMLDPEYKETFDGILAGLPDYISYKGFCDPWKSSETLHNYFLHLLPTKCPTEGQPGSVIDSFFAGVPVLCGAWESCHEMIPEGVAGASFPLCDFDELERMLLDYYNHPEKVYCMQKGALKEAEKFLPANVMQILYDKADEFR